MLECKKDSFFSFIGFVLQRFKHFSEFSLQNNVTDLLSF